MKIIRAKILGVPVDCVTMETAVAYADEIIAQDKCSAIIAMNPEKVIQCLDHPDYLQLIKSAGLLIPDGIGVVLAARLMGMRNISRVPGSELMPELCELAVKKGYSVYLYGAAEDANVAAVNALRARYPDIKIVGSQHGYLKENEMGAFVEELNRLSPDILFVALGSPRQERWISEYLPDLNVHVCQGVGGTFDVIGGIVKRAPVLFRNLHLEWLYRLLAQPRRLVRQTALPRFVYKFIISLFKRNKTNNMGIG